MYLYKTTDGKLTPYPQSGPKPLFVDSIESLAYYWCCKVTDLLLGADGTWTKKENK
jgi:hypothetical protein